MWRGRGSGRTGRGRCSGRWLRTDAGWCGGTWTARRPGGRWRSTTGRRGSTSMGWGGVASTCTRCGRRPSTTPSATGRRCTRCASSLGTATSEPRNCISCGRRKTGRWRPGASRSAWRAGTMAGGRTAFQVLPGFEPGQIACALLARSLVAGNLSGSARGSRSGSPVFRCVRSRNPTQTARRNRATRLIIAYFYRMTSIVTFSSSSLKSFLKSSRQRSESKSGSFLRSSIP